MATHLTMAAWRTALHHRLALPLGERFTSNSQTLYPTPATFAWRSDGVAIVAEPVTAADGKPQLIAITTGTHIALPKATLSYVWQTAS